MRMSIFPVGFTPNYANLINEPEKIVALYMGNGETSSKRCNVLNITKSSQVCLNLVFQNIPKDPFKTCERTQQHFSGTGL